MVDWWLAWFTTLSAAGLGWFWHWHVVRTNRNAGYRTARDLVDEANRESEVIRREAKAEAREILQSSRETLDAERNNARELIEDREDQVNRRMARLDEREQALERREARIDAQQDNLVQKFDQAEALVSQRTRALERASSLSKDQARSELLQSIEDEIQREANVLVQHYQTDARQRAKDDATQIVTLAIERYAADTVKDVTTVSVTLPSNEMKGRIIGKEGRNIRSLEAETGVNILVDDTPDVVVLSCFDPMRREVAKRTLIKLMKDGRIHPSTIEQTVSDTRAHVENEIAAEGSKAVEALGLRNVSPALLPYLGRLRYRQSYSQNVLEHSIESAHLMATIAAELGLDPEIGKRIGLFHDIGKSISHEVSGPHALIGADLLKRNQEAEIVVNAVAAHHREAEADSPYAHLAIAADAITSARPGARIGSTAHYFKRLEELEELANRHSGVERSYAIQGGRELRVLVRPEEINDSDAQTLARKLSAEIEENMEFPGVITVTVVRETRCTEYAR